MFGTERDSPNAIRDLALCFLNLGAEMDPDSRLLSLDDLINLQNRLTGKDFSCTSVLFGMMKTRFYQSTYFKSIISPNWL